MRRAVLIISLLFASIAAAELPVGEQVIHTKDGRELRGVVVSQTDQGYLLKSGDRTELIPFATIQDILPAEPMTPPPPPPAVPAEPANEAPPPPAQPDGQPPPPEAAVAVPDWRTDRKGFHWTVGAGGMVDPGIFSGGGAGTAAPIAGYVGGFAAVRWGFGWLDLQAELMPLGFFRGATKAFFVNVNPQLRINFARFYSLGVGVWAGVTIIPSVDFVVGPSFSPAIMRLGDLGQHEVRLWIAAPAIGTTAGLRSGSLLLLLLSYAYVF